MRMLDNIALVLIQRRQTRIENMGHTPCDPLPSQLRQPVLYANALLTQLWTLNAESRTQELHVVPGDLDVGNLDIEI